MIEIGQEISLVYAGSKKRWHLKIIGRAFKCYQYFPGYTISSPQSPIEIASVFPGPASSLDPYFRTEKDSTDTNKCSERFVSFVIDKYDKTLKLFVFPISVVKLMVELEKDPHDSDWEVIREGHGLSTKYYVNKLELEKLSDKELKVINETIGEISIEDALLKKKKLFVTIKYTKFNRFEIMEI